MTADHGIDVVIEAAEVARMIDQAKEFLQVGRRLLGGT